MNTIRGSNSSETKLIKAIQATVGAVQDGLIGLGTLSDIAVKLRARCWPLELTLYGQRTIITERVKIHASPGKGLATFPMGINGSFYYNGRPCSICVADGEVKCNSACHAHLGKPETVIYNHLGYIRMGRYTSASQLPTGVEWAVGGMGLLGNYDPAAEGFSGQYADVLRRTNHTMLGEKGGVLYLVYCKNMTAAQVNEHAKKLGLSKAIMLDGGHIAGINGTHTKINTKITQYYVIQGI